LELLSIILLLGICVLFFQVNSLKKRLKTLEDRSAETTEPAQSAPAQTDRTQAKPSTADTQQSGPWSPPEKREGLRLKRLIATPTNTAVEPEATNPKTFVFRADLLKAVVSWLTANWFYALAAISLALAGIFMIQYSVEAGLLSPPLRVLGAIIMGGALIFAAEYLRRKGDDESGSLAFLPSVFASGGFITLFAAFWGAHSLYGIISPLLAFAMLALVGAGAIICGWLYGPLVSAVGTIGAIATPVLLGGGSGNAHWLMPYFAAVSAASMIIDSLKRWAWLSTLAIALGISATTLIFMETEVRPVYIATMIGFVLLAAMIPIRSLRPNHPAPSLLPALFRNLLGAAPKTWPDFPPRLVLATITAASGAIILAFAAEVAVFWLCLIAIALSLAIALIWMAGADGLEDAALPPAGSLIALAVLASPEAIPALWRLADLGEEALPNDVIHPVLGLGITALLVSALAGWRSLHSPNLATPWSIAAVTFAPVLAAILEVLWRPTEQLGSTLWAVCLIVVAALMTWLTTQYAKRDGAALLRTSIALCSAIVMIAFAIVTVLSETALTVALALTVAITALISQRQNLPLLGHLVSSGAIVVSARLVVNPGLFWAELAPFWELVFVFGASIALLIAARRLLRRPESATDMILHSAVWSLGGIFTTILFFRAFEYFNLSATYLMAGLLASVWLILAFTQFYRLQSGRWMVWVRRILGSLYLIIGIGLITLSLTLLNPLFSGSAKGLPILNPLLAAYGLPALLLSAMTIKLKHLPPWARLGFGTAAGAMITFTLFVLIRHVWRRPNIQLPEMAPGELYTYTVVMMIGSGALLVTALRRKNPTLRRAAFFGLGLTAAKVFLIDASGLTGLIRVFAFLALGLSLAGLAWLNRRFGDDPILTPDPDPDNLETGEGYDTKNAG